MKDEKEIGGFKNVQHELKNFKFSREGKTIILWSSLKNSSIPLVHWYVKSLCTNSTQVCEFMWIEKVEFTLYCMSLKAMKIWQ